MKHPLAAIRERIYYPRCESLRRLSAEAAAEGLRPWRDQHEQYIGWKRHRSGARAKNRLLVFHGNADCAVSRYAIVYGFEALSGGSWEVYLLEYPGYGARLGAPGEKAFKAATEAAVRLLQRESKRPLFIVGESIGSGVAAYIAGRFPKTICGLLLITPFDTFARLVRAIVRIPIPSILLTEQYHNIRELNRYKGRLAVLLAGKDDIVPVKLGRNLYNRYSGPKRLWVDGRATHNSIIKPNAKWWHEISDFLLGAS